MKKTITVRSSAAAPQPSASAPRRMPGAARPSPAAAAASRAGARPAPGRAASPSVRPSPRKQEGSNAWIGFVVAGIIVVIIAVIVAAQPKKVPARRAAPPAAKTTDTYEPKRFAELGGKTMAEYERENNKNNEMLQQRKARVTQHETRRGVQPAP